MGRTGRRRRCRRNNVVECYEHTELYRSLGGLGWENGTELRVANFEETGKGLFSRRGFKAGDCIISLPFESLISLKSIEEDEAFLACFNKDALADFSKGELQFQSLLALYLIYLRLEDNSPRKAYLNSIPESFTTPYFCSKLEMANLPNVVLKQMVQQNEIIKQNFTLLQSILNNDSLQAVDLDLFKWAYFAVNTRSVYLEPRVLKLLLKGKTTFFAEKLKDEPNMALAPFLDFFNHNAGAETTSKLSISYESLTKQFKKNQITHLYYELFTSKPVPPFSQIFISYGTHNNTKLLLEYGFSLPANPQDFLELTLDDINAFIRADPELRPLKIHREKYRFIADHSLGEQLFFVPGDLLSHNLAVCLTLLFVEQNIYQLRTVAFGELPPLDPIRDLATRLAQFKLRELETSSRALAKLPDLTASAFDHRRHNEPGKGFSWRFASSGPSAPPKTTALGTNVLGDIFRKRQQKACCINY
ncbi:conserved hypothetical protein [Culex quinquefasciatus]|uniref:SET domain-containing protein n=1 Tax=Culex quinquefasciatus TaxID=7176 RepID=B0WKB0_CULQU|nr:conserved hypothetical protein [Culex quinquefasciatus]|eukprot:XP_001849144.1 conserved hypothetical protein [Culex quinquefasciatus]